jgi:hypothetical protein
MRARERERESKPVGSRTIDLKCNSLDRRSRIAGEKINTRAQCDGRRWEEEGELLCKLRI